MASLWNSTSTTISIASTEQRRQAEIDRIDAGPGVGADARRSAKPLPAPTSSTSKVTGLVLPNRVNWPSTLPRRVLICRKAVDTNVASGKAPDFRKLSPARSSAKPLTLEVIDAVSTLADSEALAGVGGIPLQRAAQAVEAEDAAGVAQMRDPRDDRGMVGIERIGAGRRLLVVGFAHIDARRQAVGLTTLRVGRHDRCLGNESGAKIAMFPIETFNGCLPGHGTGPALLSGSPFFCSTGRGRKSFPAGGSDSLFPGL